MKTHVKLLLLISVMPFLLASCGGDDDPTPAEQIAGTYDYEVEYFILDGDDLVELGYEISGTAIASKEGDSFVVKEGGETVFEANTIESASNGFTFNIDSQDVEIDGQEVTVEGYDGVSLGNGEYHGMYETDGKELTAFLMAENVIIEIDGDLYEVTLVFKFVGEKQ